MKGERKVKPFTIQTVLAKFKSPFKIMQSAYKFLFN